MKTGFGNPDLLFGSMPCALSNRLLLSGTQENIFSGLAIFSVMMALALFVAFLLWNRAMREKAALRQTASFDQFAGSWTDTSVNRRKILVYSLAIMSGITICVGAIATYLLYIASFEQQRQRLVETTSAQARLIEAVARFDRSFSKGAIEGGATAATISQLVDAHQHQTGLGETGEFTLARLEGEEMVFLLDRRHSTSQQSLRISYRDSELAEPMRRALSGQSGTVVATDYRGELVLAAYEPVGEIQLGIVAKIDLDEIRQPFTRAGLVGLGVAALLILCGGLILVWVNTPLIKRVEDRERRLNAIVTNVVDAIFTIDEHGSLLSFNQAAEAIFGYKSTELIGSSVAILIEGAEGDLEGRIAKLRGERHEVIGRRKNGDTFPMDVAVNPMHQGDSPTFVGIARDITHRKQAEEDIQLARLAAEEASRDAQAANLAKSDFLSHMSHELRTPLNGILGYAQILQRDSHATAGQKSNVQSILSCGEHLLTLINDVLDLSKIEAGKLDVDARPCNLHKLLRAVGDIVGQRARGKGLEFEIDVSPEVPQGVITDSSKLRQILINLAGNAVKFTEQGLVTIHVSESPKEFLLLKVVDSGVGMSPEELEVIFDAFKQVEAGKDAGGTGLGLAISKRLAEAIGGDLSVESEQGVGSTFAVQIPLVEADPAKVAALSHDDTTAIDSLILAPGQECSILVADDRDTNREVLRALLEGVGFSVILAIDGQDALDVLRRNSEIDLVLMDVRMPRLNGIEAVRQIRANEHLKAIKVIAVTASVFPEFRERAIESGFDDFLGKPFRVGELMEKLQKHLQLNFKSSESGSGEDGSATHDHSNESAPVLSSELLVRLRQSLQIKNLTAIKDLAAELIADPANRRIGMQVQDCASTFNFARLTQLVEELENTSA